MTTEFQTWIDGDENAIDLQLRGNNRLMFYYGQFCVADLAIDKSGMQFQIQVAGKNDPELIPVPYGRDLTRVPELKNDLPGMVQNAAAWCDENRPTTPYASRRGRGFHLNQLIGEYGRRWRNTDPWLLLDRYGFVQPKSANEDRVTRKPIIDGYAGTLKQYAGPRRSLLDGSLKAPCVTDTCDLVGVNQNGELLTINVCDGEQSRERLAAALIHTACARDVFSAALPNIDADLRRLWRQKVELGLVPRGTEQLSARAFTGVKGTLFIVNPPKDPSGQISELRNIMNEHPNLRMPIVCWRDREEFTTVETSEPKCV